MDDWFDEFIDYGFDHFQYQWPEDEEILIPADWVEEESDVNSFDIINGVW